MAGNHLTIDTKATPISGIDNRSYRTLAQANNPQDTHVPHISPTLTYKALDTQDVGSSPFVTNPDKHFYPLQGSTTTANLVQASMLEESQQMAPIFDINSASVVHVSDNEKNYLHTFMQIAIHVLITTGLCNKLK